tara:strand:- start:881 stop:1168 length:288 start_codon:yes stop_codon:yes gene_type:complete
MKELRRKIRKILKESNHELMFGQNISETNSPEQIAKNIIIKALDQAIINKNYRELDPVMGENTPQGIEFDIYDEYGQHQTSIQVNYMGQISCKQK